MLLLGFVLGGNYFIKQMPSGSILKPCKRVKKKILYRGNRSQTYYISRKQPIHDATVWALGQTIIVAYLSKISSPVKRLLTTDKNARWYCHSSNWVFVSDLRSLRLRSEACFRLFLVFRSLKRMFNIFINCFRPEILSFRTWNVQLWSGPYQVYNHQINPKSTDQRRFQNLNYK